MEKKKNEKKKQIIDFDKIDVTTATDDDIIRSGIKKNVTSDYICYFVMFLIVVFIFIPPALWIFNPKPITEEDREIVYVELNCNRTVSRDGYELTTNLTSEYRQTFVTKSTLILSYRSNTEAPLGDVSIAEVNEMNGLNYKEIKTTKGENKYTYEIDYKSNYNVLSKDEVLKDYAYIPNAEIQYLSNLGFRCISDSKTVVERVYIDTEEKVED